MPEQKSGWKNSRNGGRREAVWLLMEEQPGTVAVWLLMEGQPCDSGNKMIRVSDSGDR
jgi:hypothetical protein